MFLAWRDLRVARGRFALVGAVIALVALLAGLLSGLATGLVDDGISGLRRLPLTHLAFQDGAGAEFSRSSLDLDDLRPWTAALGDGAAPLGVSFFNARTSSGVTVDLSLFGTAPDSFLAPGVEAKNALTRGGIVLSDTLADVGIAVGDLITVVGPDVELEVLGFTYGGSYGHVDLAFTSLETWQELMYGDAPRSRFNAIALEASDADVAELADNTGLVVHTKDAAYAGSPGFAAESATMKLIRTFLVLISAMVIGAFFTVWTVQRTHQIGLLKALGASNSYVARDALGQIAVVITVATAAGTAVAALAGLAVGTGIPFRLDAASLIGTAALLVGAGLLGSLAALWRITRVDPAIALAAQA